MGRKKLNLKIKKNCLFCGKQLNIKINRDINRKKFCSHNCEWRYRRAKLLQKIPNNLEDLYLKQKKSCFEIARIFEVGDATIHRWLKVLDIKTRSDFFHRRMQDFVCDDGHLADSCFEQRVDNWLFHNNILHSIHYKVFPNRKFTADFKVGDILIECDGFEDRRINKKGFEEKIELYQKNNLKFMILTPAEDMNIKLSILLKRYTYLQHNLKKYINNLEVNQNSNNEMS